jgi:hypothetical protein
MHTAMASGQVLLTWLAAGALTCGLGLVLRHAVARTDGLDGDGLLSGFWLGLAGTVLSLQLVHLFAPIGWPVGAVRAALGAAGLVAHRAPLAQLLRSRRPSGAAALWMAVVGAWMADRALGACTAFDSALYHAPVIEWARRFPAVPGLGNLHSRLVFNNASLLWAAMLDHGVWSRRSSHVVNGVFLLALAAQIGLSLSRLVHTRAEPSDLGRCVFDLALLTPLFAMAGQSHFLTSFTTDVPTAVALFAAASALRALLSRSWAGRDAGTELVAVVALLALAVCFKLSTVVFASAAAALALGSCLKRRGEDGAPSPGAFVVAASFAAVLLGGWAARGVIQSGYPAFPSTLLAAPVDWRVPAEQADAERAWIGHVGRGYYSPETHNRPYGEAAPWEGRWLRGWLGSLRSERQALWQITLPVALAIPLLLLSRLGTPRPREVPLLLFPAAVGIAFWLVTAPKPVYAFPLFWVLAAAIAAEVLPPLLVGRRRRAAFAAAALALGVAPLAASSLAVARAGRGLRAAIEKHAFTRWTEDAWFRPEPDEDVEAYRTASGLPLLVPTTGNRCGRAPLPCTPHPAPNLALRRSGELGDGFVTDGRWEQLRFPNPGNPGFVPSWRDYLRLSPRR